MAIVYSTSLVQSISSFQYSNRTIQIHTQIYSNLSGSVPELSLPHTLLNISLKIGNMAGFSSDVSLDIADLVEADPTGGTPVTFYLEMHRLCVGP